MMVTVMMGMFWIMLALNAAFDDNVYARFITFILGSMFLCLAYAFWGINE